MKSLFLASICIIGCGMMGVSETLANENTDFTIVVIGDDAINDSLNSYDQPFVIECLDGINGIDFVAVLPKNVIIPKPYLGYVDGPESIDVCSLRTSDPKCRSPGINDRLCQ